MRSALPAAVSLMMLLPLFAFGADEAGAPAGSGGRQSWQQILARAPAALRAPQLDRDCRLSLSIPGARRNRNGGNRRRSD